MTDLEKTEVARLKKRIWELEMISALWRKSQQLEMEISSRDIHSRFEVWFDRMIKLVCEIYLVDAAEIFGNRRFSSIIDARQVAMHCCYQHCPIKRLTFRDIDRLFHRGPGAARYSDRTVLDHMASDRHFREKVERLVSELSKPLVLDQLSKEQNEQTICACGGK
jgi:chromosomal replication initiation ATPase DnaA